MLTSGRSECIGFRMSRGTFVPRKEVFGVSGGAALIRRAVFDKIGLFDERFHAYLEDADFSYRARLAGFRAACAQHAVVYHVGSASIQDRLWWRARQCFENHAPLLFRFAPHILKERFTKMRQLVSAARTQFGLAGALVLLLRAELSLLKSIPYAIGQRRVIQRTRVLGASALARQLTRESELL